MFRKDSGKIQGMFREGSRNFPGSFESILICRLSSSQELRSACLALTCFRGLINDYCCKFKISAASAGF